MKPTKQSDAQICKRLLMLTKGDKVDYGICPPPMDAQAAVNELARYLLGDEWYISFPLSQEQANTEIVYEIERLYKKQK